eukprot:141408_1
MSFTNCHQLPFCFNSYIPKPSLDSTNKNMIIISTSSTENGTTPGIYRYNLVSNKSQIIYKYSGTYRYLPDRHGQFIDISNNTLILYGGKTNELKIFDLNANQMKQILITARRIYILSKCKDFPQNAFIPSPINEIHILSREYNHCKFDIANKETVKIKTNWEELSLNVPSPKLLYIKLHKKLYVFGGHYNDKIFVYSNNKW